MSEIPKEDEKISGSTLLYHLGKLEEDNIIKSQKIHGKRMYFPNNLRSKEIEEAFMHLSNENAKNIFIYILNNRNCYQNQIAKALDIHHDTVRHHVEKLEEARLITKSDEGKTVNFNIGQVGEQILEGSLTVFSERYIRFIISKLADDCHFPEIIEKTKDKLVIRVICPREDDIELSIDISGWEIETSFENEEN